jgi:cell division septum initiation protein DivIVA
MPDQSSAATEHALIQEITTPLAALPEDPMRVAAEVDFPVVLRGYDRIAVDAYVKKTSQLVAELQATRSPEAAVRRALDRVGGEVSGILQRAHETASEITAQSRSEAEDRLESARQEAERIVAAARTEVQELDAETDRVWAERQRIVEDARDLARQLLGLADSAAERFPADDDGPAGSEATTSSGATTPFDQEPAPDSSSIPVDGLGEARASRPHTEELDEIDETVEREGSLIPPPPGAHEVSRPEES